MKKIIIDGVDVAGCISFDKNNGYNICCYDDTREDKIPFANFCVENKDCYYKQLKRLEQENEELKEELLNHKSLIWYIYCGSEDNLAEDIIGEYYNCKNDSDKKYLKNFWKKIYNLEQTEGRIKRDKLKQALQEIKKTCVEAPCCDTEFSLRVLQIINEE